MPKGVVAVLVASVIGVACCPRAQAQGNVLYPGSTVQGDILRGEGVKYKGAAVFYLNAAKARSIDADTQMRFNQYVYNSYQEYLRQRSRRMAAKVAGRSANLAEIERRLRENPSESDVVSGDALNVTLTDLADPRISPSLWARAKVPLPANIAATAPFQYASAGGVLSLRRLKVGDTWPIALRYQALEPQRLAYERAVAALLDLCRRRALTPEAVDAVGVAARGLKSRAAEIIPLSSADFRQSALRTADLLERSARALTRSDYVEDLLAELDDFRGATVADLLDLMRRYNLHFGPADSPEERGLYQELYPLLRKQYEALGLHAAPMAGPPVAPPLPAARSAIDAEAQRLRNKARVVGTWRRWINGVDNGEIRLLGNGRINRINGQARWTYDGTTLVMTWPGMGDPADMPVDRCVLAPDGRSFEGTARRGAIIKAVKVSND